MRALSPASLLVLLAACGGGSADEERVATPSAAALRVVVDTGADANAEIAGELDIVAFERAGGGFTADLLDGSQPLVLADPEGASSGFDLGQVPPGQYTAVQLSFLPGSLRARLQTGEEGPIRSGSSIRIPFDGVLDLSRSDALCAVQHRRPAVCTPAPRGEFDWQPDLRLLVTDMHPMRDERATILSVDVGALTALAEVPAWDLATTELAFDRAMLLLINGLPVTAAEFLSQLAPQDEILLIDALVRRRGELLVLAASDLPPAAPLPGRGNKSEVRGVIQSLLSAQQAFVLSVRRVHKAGVGFPAGPRPTLIAVVDHKTKIKWLPRRARHTGHLGFEDLRPGMVVDLEWHGPPAQNAVVAHKVDIRSSGRGRLNFGRTDRVRSIDLQNDRIVIEPTAGTGGLFPTVVVQLAPDSLLLRRDGGALNVVTLEDIQPGDRIEVLAHLLGGSTGSIPPTGYPSGGITLGGTLISVTR